MVSKWTSKLQAQLGKEGFCLHGGQSELVLQQECWKSDHQRASPGVTQMKQSFPSADIS